MSEPIRIVIADDHAPTRAGIRAVTTLDLKKNEQQLIRHALEKFKGNRKRAASALKISPVTLWRKMKEYGLTDE